MILPNYQKGQNKTQSSFLVINISPMNILICFKDWEKKSNSFLDFECSFKLSKRYPSYTYFMIYYVLACVYKYKKSPLCLFLFLCVMKQNHFFPNYSLPNSTFWLRSRTQPLSNPFSSSLNLDIYDVKILLLVAVFLSQIL